MKLKREQHFDVEVINNGCVVTTSQIESMLTLWWAKAKRENLSVPQRVSNHKGLLYVTYKDGESIPATEFKVWAVLWNLLEPAGDVYIIQNLNETKVEL